MIIPVAPKDAADFPTCLESVLRHCRNPIRTIHVVSREPVAGHDRRVRWLDESKVMPGAADIAGAVHSTPARQGNASWYFQQLLKLRCFELLGSDAPDHVLVVDADIAFATDMSFVDKYGRAQLALGYPLRWSAPAEPAVLPDRHSAIDAASRLVPGWRPVDHFSGMQHHMVFDRVVLTDLVRRAEAAHGAPFWQAFLRTREPSKWTGASEYVLYRHFACRFFPERVAMRHLSAVEVIHSGDTEDFRLADVLAALGGGFHAVGCHRFLDYDERVATMDYIPDDLRRRLPANAPLQLRLINGAVTVAPIADTGEEFSLAPSQRVGGRVPDIERG
ncbi:hypothetical protein SAMN04489726_1091 [Allokutzneria albata]|uniref:Nucleotide-diphospho-sugar transferase n=1 Tax=Allokutzneria albata TaxID=211114 RepID=A0A1G9SDF0_ALLAB|nr:hypothetical protein SAMN04489726_1091 [Allokutzneria albata]